MDKNIKKLQIGVMGSMADLKYLKTTENLAEQIGYYIAKNRAILVFGAEKDFDSLSTAACRGAKKANGLTVGVTYGKGLDIYEKNADVVIASGLERGGGRELPLVLSCDVVIAVGGGSGTLTEIAIAYQANIPVVVMKNTGGWSEKLANTYLDDRKRFKIETAKTAKEAVDKAFALVDRRKKKTKQILYLTGVHGDEKIGIETLIKMEKEGLPVSWIVGNKKAIKAKKRYIDSDLNRVAPGKLNSKKYEIRRAAEIVNIFKEYQYIIDIHGTDSDTGIFTIVTNPTSDNLLLAGCLPIKNIVIWPSSSNNKITGSLVSFAKYGVEIECGPKSDPKVNKQLAGILKKISYNTIEIQKSDIASKKIFKVYGKLIEKPSILLKNFKKINLSGESFYPLLVGQYKNIVCYKMKKIELFN